MMCVQDMKGRREKTYCPHSFTCGPPGVPVVVVVGPGLVCSVLVTYTVVVAVSFPAVTVTVAVTVDTAVQLDTVSPDFVVDEGDGIVLLLTVLVVSVVGGGVVGGVVVVVVGGEGGVVVVVLPEVRAE